MVVDHDLALGVVVHGVDGEVAADRVFFLRAPDVVAQDAAGGVHRVFHVGQLALAGAFVARDLLGGGVVHVGAEGGDFDDFVFAAPAIDHVDDTKTPPDDESAAKQAFDLLGRGVGGHVEVFGPQADQQVAHRTADDVGLKTGLLQGADHVEGALVDQVGVDAVLGDGDFDAFAKLGRFGGRLFAEYFVDEGLDHGCSVNRSSMRQPRWVAMARSGASGLVATGCCTFSSRARSLMESE